MQLPIISYKEYFWAGRRQYFGLRAPLKQKIIQQRLLKFFWKINIKFAQKFKIFLKI